MLYIEDESDDESLGSEGEIGLDGYVALVKGYSHLVTGMAEEEERKREVVRRETMEAWLAGVVG